MSSKTYHVLLRDGGWALHRVGVAGPKIFTTQKEAIATARKQIGNKAGKIVIHGVDGHIRDVEYFKLPRIQTPVSPKSAKARKLDRIITSMILDPHFAAAN